MIFAGIALFLLKEGSRNQMNNARDGAMQRNFRALFGFRLPHMDSVDDVLRALPAEQLEQLRVAMVHTLLERKLLRPLRLEDKWYLVGIDATGVMTANENDEGTLKKESKNGKVTFTRQVLEAKIIVPGGMTISIASEWLATDQNDNGSKEDCELNAFKRLAEKIKSYFPRLPLCILVDSLYPSASFFTICAAKCWRFCAVLKDKKLSTVWDQVDKALADAEAAGNVVNMLLDNNTTIEWVTGLDYRGTKVSWLECIEGSGGERQRFVFVTDVELGHDSVRQLVTAGRSRWRLEDAFNTQKRRGYMLSHKYSRVSFLATKNYYVLMQIAHLLNQLVEYSQHLARIIDHSKETLQHLWGLIVAALVFVDDDAHLAPKQRRTQYRFRFG
jgi:hypothetical protein